MPASPYLIQFESLGNPEEGYLTSTQHSENIPFAIKRAFWVHATPPGFVRGKHANKATEEVLIAVSGSIKVKTDTGKEQFTFELSNEKSGLYIPAMCWTELCFSPGAIAVCLTSTNYEPADYIWDYEQFKKLASHIEL